MGWLWRYLVKRSVWRVLVAVVSIAMVAIGVLANGVDERSIDEIMEGIRREL